MFVLLHTCTSRLLPLRSVTGLLPLPHLLVRVLGALLVDVVLGVVESLLVADSLGRVALDELLDLLELLLGKVDGFEVLLNTRRGDRLGQGVNSPLDEPAEKDGGSTTLLGLGNLGDDRVLTERLSVGSSERGVGAWEDVVLLQPGDELVLGALDRELDLV